MNSFEIERGQESGKSTILSYAIATVFALHFFNVQKTLKNTSFVLILVPFALERFGFSLNILNNFSLFVLILQNNLICYASRYHQHFSQ